MIFFSDTRKSHLSVRAKCATSVSLFGAISACEVKIRSRATHSNAMQDVSMDNYASAACGIVIVIKSSIQNAKCTQGSPQTAIHTRFTKRETERQTQLVRVIRNDRIRDLSHSQTPREPCGLPQPCVQWPSFTRPWQPPGSDLNGHGNPNKYCKRNRTRCSDGGDRPRSAATKQILAHTQFHCKYR